jgi:predicted dinucleotide-binding enzyme
MKVGILGSGDVAQSLAAGFASRGDDVTVGTGHPEKLAQFATERPNVTVSTFANAARHGELVVIAVLGDAAVALLEEIGADAFDGKTVIDTTNPLRFDDRGPQLSVGFTDSLGERIQRQLPNARVVKAFNTVGAPEMVKPSFDGGPPSMFIAGNDADAKRTAADILHDFGWDVVDLGGIEASRYLEPMCMAWITYGARSGQWHHAFKMLR